MRELFPGKWSTPWVFAALLTALICAVSIYVLFFPLGKNQLAPAVPVISACKELAPGMRRIGNRYGIQFDVPKNEFTFGEGRSDAGPLVGGFDLSTKNGHSLLVISTRQLPGGWPTSLTSVNCGTPARPPCSCTRRNYRT